jgi:hypothetical protein
MPNTYKKIASVVVGSGGTSAINFTSIPQTFTDLKIVLSLRTTGTEASGYADGIITFNGTTTNYSERMVYGIGSSPGSASQSSTGIKWQFGNSSITTASVFSNNEIYIPNYTSTNYKSVSIDTVVENNSATVNINAMTAGLWSNTAAITSVTITPGSGSFVQYSTATLYGIGDVPSKFAKAVGGMITTDSTYVYHTFTSSHVFIPNQNLTVDYLVVAGGGGGGARYGAGGGAGGLRCTVGATGGGGSLESALSLTASTSYTVTVGAGGAAGIQGTNNSSGSNGSNSVFSNITSTGGGGGAGNGNLDPQNAGGNGGSSGGGTYSNGAAGTRTASPIQGYNGGPGSGSFFGGGGGGGAGGAGVGGDTGDSSLCVGGSSLTTSISGISTSYAGGGGAYNAAGGGGGAGNNVGAGAGTSATANTGSGGGASTINQSAGAGGSGIVIVRYLR